MFMRYYPKDIQPIKRMAVPASDRGRKHYWGHECANYGFYESEDLQQIAKMNKNRHRRTHTIEIDRVAKGEKQPRLSKQQPEVPLIPKHSLSLSKAIEVHLPSISRATRQSQTEYTVKENPQSPQKSHNSNKIFTPEQYKSFKNRQMQQNMTADLKQTTRKDRLLTEPTMPSSSIRRKYNSIHDGSEHAIRFSPTFVCSLQNPMPVYKLYPKKLKGFQN